MAEPAPWSEPRAPVSFRVGVTGTRSIPDGSAMALRASAAAILRLVRDEVVKDAEAAHASGVYAHDARGAALTHIRLVSPLAAGADRLVAKEALALDYHLYSPFPFSQKDYEKDFGADLEEFRALAGKAQILELDGGRGEDENASYEAVGRFVVRNADLLIALWDGKPARGRGGTAEIVQYAVRSGLPVWWINVATGEAKLVSALAHLKAPGPALEGAKAEAALADYIARMVVPAAAAPHPKEGGVLGHLAHRLRDWIEPSASFLSIYVGERPAPVRTPWRAYDRMLSLLAPPPADEKSARMEGAATPVELWWERHYLRADALSQAYANRYRSSYVLITALAFTTFIASSLFHAGVRSPVTIWLEWILLMCIGALAVLNHMRGWQERWISYRLLAELCRNQLVLAPLGRALPGSEVRRSALETAADRERADMSSESWVGWYFVALQRAAPTPAGDARTCKARAFALGRSLVAEQADYHALRRLRVAQADRRLAAGGELSFFLVVVVVTLQLALMGLGARFAGLEWLQAVTAILSALSAGFVALRAYAEFALLARQSLRMRETMREVEIELDSLSLDEPLASQRLGAALHRLTILMMQEVRGWAQIFRLKTVEAG